MQDADKSFLGDQHVEGVKRNGTSNQRVLYAKAEAQVPSQKAGSPIFRVSYTTSPKLKNRMKKKVGVVLESLFSYDTLMTLISKGRI